MQIDRIIDILWRIIISPPWSVIIILYTIFSIIKFELKWILEFITGKLEDKIKIIKFKPVIEWLGITASPVGLTTRLTFRNKSPWRFKIDYINLNLFLAETRMENYHYDREKDSKVPEGLIFSNEIMEEYADSWEMETSNKFPEGIIDDFPEPPRVSLKGEVVFSTIRGYRKVRKSIDESEKINREKWEEIKNTIKHQRGLRKR